MSTVVYSAFLLLLTVPAEHSAKRSLSYKSTVMVCTLKTKAQTHAQLHPLPWGRGCKKTLKTQQDLMPSQLTGRLTIFTSTALSSLNGAIELLSVLPTCMLIDAQLKETCIELQCLSISLCSNIHNNTFAERISTQQDYSSFVSSIFKIHPILETDSHGKGNSKVLT